MGHMSSDDIEFMKSLESGTLANASFHHAEHVRMAFLYLCSYSAFEALQRFSSALKRFAAANGHPERYNETITWGFLLLIHERMARAGRDLTWTEFAAANPDLMSWKNNVLRRYYREETLSSDLARRLFLFPDKVGGVAS